MEGSQNSACPDDINAESRAACDESQVVKGVTSMKSIPCGQSPLTQDITTMQSSPCGQSPLTQDITTMQSSPGEHSPVTQDLTTMQLCTGEQSPVTEDMNRIQSTTVDGGSEQREPTDDVGHSCSPSPTGKTSDSLEGISDIVQKDTNELGPSSQSTGDSLLEDIVSQLAMGQSVLEDQVISDTSEFVIESPPLEGNGGDVDNGPIDGATLDGITDVDNSPVDGATSGGISDIGNRHVVDQNSSMAIQNESDKGSSTDTPNAPFQSSSHTTNYKTVTVCANGVTKNVMVPVDTIMPVGNPAVDFITLFHQSLARQAAALTPAASGAPRVGSAETTPVGSNVASSTNLTFRLPDEGVTGVTQSESGPSGEVIDVAQGDSNPPDRVTSATQGNSTVSEQLGYRRRPRHHCKTVADYLHARSKGAPGSFGIINTTVQPRRRYRFPYRKVICQPRATQEIPIDLPANVTSLGKIFSKRFLLGKRKVRYGVPMDTETSLLKNIKSEPNQNTTDTGAGAPSTSDTYSGTGDPFTFAPQISSVVSLGPSSSSQHRTFTTRDTDALQKSKRVSNGSGVLAVDLFLNEDSQKEIESDESDTENPPHSIACSFSSSASSEDDNTEFTRFDYASSESNSELMPNNNAELSFTSSTYDPFSKQKEDIFSSWAKQRKESQSVMSSTLLPSSSGSHAAADSLHACESDTASDDMPLLSYVHNESDVEAPAVHSSSDNDKLLQSCRLNDEQHIEMYKLKRCSVSLSRCDHSKVNTPKPSVESINTPGPSSESMDRLEPETVTEEPKPCPETKKCSVVLQALPHSSQIILRLLGSLNLGLYNIQLEAIGKSTTYIESLVYPSRGNRYEDYLGPEQDEEGEEESRGVQESPSLKSYNEQNSVDSIVDFPDIVIPPQQTPKKPVVVTSRSMRFEYEEPSSPIIPAKKRNEETERPDVANKAFLVRGSSGDTFIVPLIPDQQKGAKHSINIQANVELISILQMLDRQGQKKSITLITDPRKGKRTGQQTEKDAKEIWSSITSAADGNDATSHEIREQKPSPAELNSSLANFCSPNPSRGLAQVEENQQHGVPQETTSAGSVPHHPVASKAIIASRSNAVVQSVAVTNSVNTAPTKTTAPVSPITKAASSISCSSSAVNRDGFESEIDTHVTKQVGRESPVSKYIKESPSHPVGFESSGSTPLRKYVPHRAARKGAAANTGTAPTRTTFDLRAAVSKAVNPPPKQNCFSYQKAVSKIVSASASDTSGRHSVSSNSTSTSPRPTYASSTSTSQRPTYASCVKADHNRTPNKTRMSSRVSSRASVDSNSRIWQDKHYVNKAQNQSSTSRPGSPSSIRPASPSSVFSISSHSSGGACSLQSNKTRDKKPKPVCPDGLNQPKQRGPFTSRVSCMDIVIKKYPKRSSVRSQECASGPLRKRKSQESPLLKRKNSEVSEVCPPKRFSVSSSDRSSLGSQTRKIRDTLAHLKTESSQARKMCDTLVHIKTEGELSKYRDLSGISPSPIYVQSDGSISASKQKGNSHASAHKSKYINLSGTCPSPISVQLDQNVSPGIQTSNSDTSTHKRTNRDLSGECHSPISVHSKHVSISSSGRSSLGSQKSKMGDFMTYKKKDMSLSEKCPPISVDSDHSGISEEGVSSQIVPYGRGLCLQRHVPAMFDGIKSQDMRPTSKHKQMSSNIRALYCTDLFEESDSHSSMQSDKGVLETNKSLANPLSGQKDADRFTKESSPICLDSDDSDPDAPPSMPSSHPPMDSDKVKFRGQSHGDEWKRLKGPYLNSLIFERKSNVSMKKFPLFPSTFDSLLTKPHTVEQSRSSTPQHEAVTSSTRHQRSSSPPREGVTGPTRPQSPTHLPYSTKPMAITSYFEEPITWDDDLLVEEEAIPTAIPKADRIKLLKESLNHSNNKLEQVRQRRKETKNLLDGLDQ